LDGDYTLFWIAGWAKLILVGMIIAALCRLYIRQRQFSLARQNLQKMHADFADAILYRLTDEEIISFSQMNSEGIAHYAKEQKDRSLRWKLIWEAYLKENLPLRH
jgi:hypothetical protein